MEGKEGEAGEGEFKGMRSQAATEGKAGQTQTGQRGLGKHQSSAHPILKWDLRVSWLWAAKPQTQQHTTCWACHPTLATPTIHSQTVLLSRPSSHGLEINATAQRSTPSGWSRSLQIHVIGAIFISLSLFPLYSYKMTFKPSYVKFLIQRLQTCTLQN